jgi:hypothetical protein
MGMHFPIGFGVKDNDSIHFIRFIGWKGKNITDNNALPSLFIYVVVAAGARPLAD